MKNSFLGLTILLLAVGSALLAQTAAAPKAATKANATEPNLLNPATLKAKSPAVYLVKLNTTKGPVVIRVTRDWAPNGADRFYNLVLGGFFTDAAFFRVIPGFMAQFGISARPEVSKIWATSNFIDDPVKGSNRRGIVTFSQTGAPNSRSTQLFINYGNNARLDHDRFAPFGEVIEGMAAVDQLYSGYGEQPDQGSIIKQGKAFLDLQFPRLDRISTAVIEPLPDLSSAIPFIPEGQVRNLARFTGTWYRAEYGGTLEISEQKGVLTAKGGRLYSHITNVRIEGDRLLFTAKDLGQGYNVSGHIDDGVLKISQIYDSGESGPEHWFVRDEKLAKAMKKENDEARKASEDPAEAAARRAQNLALIAGVMGQVAQARTDIARTNAEAQQRIEQQKAEQARRQQQQDQQQQEALNQRLAAQRAQQQAQEQAQQQQALDQRDRDQQATDLRLQAQAAANNAAAQQLQQQKTQQQQKAPAPKQVASNSASPRAQAPAPRPNQQQPAPQPTPQTQPPVRTQPALSDLAIEDVQLHDPNAIDGDVCFVSYTLFNHFNRTVSITVDVDVVSRGLESRASYVDGIGPNMGYTFKHQENIRCRPADADGRTGGTGHIRAVE